MSRILSIDLARGFFILLMIVYHFLFDIYYFQIFLIPLFSLPFLAFRTIIGSSFIIISGISFVASESRNREGLVRHWKRAFALASVAILITFVTWVYPHDGFIQFGIIHLLAVCAFLAPFFSRLKTPTLVILSVCIISAGFYASSTMISSPYLFWFGFVSPNYYALDHYPLLPWLGVFLIGIATGKYLVPYLTRLQTNSTKVSNSSRNTLYSFFAFLGKYSLQIYLIHQPIIIGLFILSGTIHFSI